MWFRKKKDYSKVRIYDPDNRSLSEIPAEELAPGMIRVEVEGIEGEVWADVSRLRKSDYRHPPFTEEIRDYLREIRQKLDEVYPLSLEEWEDDFRRDQNPEREIAIWLFIAERYAEQVNGRSLNPVQKMDVFRILVSCSNNPKENVLSVTHLEALPREEAQRIVDRFFYKPGGE
ncbi:MAG: hypothetical protein KY468_05320 [Armatimonadetes bacterium]|nr:hypothetical protein [Armatimonadota bacterium]